MNNWKNDWRIERTNPCIKNEQCHVILRISNLWSFHYNYELCAKLAPNKSWWLFFFIFVALFNFIVFLQREILAEMLKTEEKQKQSIMIPERDTNSKVKPGLRARGNIQSRINTGLKKDSKNKENVAQKVFLYCL